MTFDGSKNRIVDEKKGKLIISAKNSARKTKQKNRHQFGWRSNPPAGELLTCPTIPMTANQKHECVKASLVCFSLPCVVTPSFILFLHVVAPSVRLLFFLRNAPRHNTTLCQFPPRSASLSGSRAKPQSVVSPHISFLTGQITPT